jgi:hypothetical protein
MNDALGRRRLSFPNFFLAKFAAKLYPDDEVP